MNVLFISNLFPNAAEPTRGVFNAQQVAALSKLCSVTVIAPTPTALPDEKRAGVRVMHPRFFHVPVLSRPFNGWLFARAIESCLREARFDVALASWAYSDAYGVMLFAKKYGFPFAAAVLGSDVNVFFKDRHRKRQILRALRASTVVFAKSKALSAILAAEGIESIVEYNGIDRAKFHTIDRTEACRKLQLPESRRRILFIGNLVPIKGPTYLVEAFRKLADLEDVDVILIGTGPESKEISASQRVQLIGSRAHTEIASWINACDLLCLPSLNEGLPNAALEAMACGVPVVASKVGGVPEIVREGVNGFMVPPSEPDALADALRRALETKWDRDVICASVAKFDWDMNARTVLEHLRRCRHQ